MQSKAAAATILFDVFIILSRYARLWRAREAALWKSAYRCYNCGLIITEFWSQSTVTVVPSANVVRSLR